MLSNSNRPSQLAPLNAIDAASGVLMGFLHCGDAEALALLRAQSHAAHVTVAQVAAGVIEGDSRQKQWLWDHPRRSAQPLTERCA